MDEGFVLEVERVEGSKRESGGVRVLRGAAMLASSAAWSVSMTLV
jgi:hypothetical protein